MRRMRSRHIKQDNAPEEEEVRKDWILDKSAVVVDRPVNSK